MKLLLMLDKSNESKEVKFLPCLYDASHPKNFLDQLANKHKECTYRFDISSHSLIT